MNSWTLRQQRTREIRQGYKQEHTAALRATRYVRRHAMEFHGAGVADAVRDLAAFSRASQNARAGVASVLAAFRLIRVSEPYGRCPDCKSPNLAPGLVHQCPVNRVSEAAPCLGTHDTWAVCKECA